MNLQPVYPARSPYESRLPGACTNCGKDVMTGTGFADLDGAPFKAYVCIQCVRYSLRRNDIVDALVARDAKERRPQHPQAYSLAGRIG